MSRTLGQRLVVENVVGAGGTTGSLRGKRANPDGYTIQMGHTGTHAISVSLYPNLAYKPDADFEPIGIVVYQPLLIAARKDFPATDIKEFVTYVKANSEKLNLAHTGVGSNSFTYALMLNTTHRIAAPSGTMTADSAEATGAAKTMGWRCENAGRHREKQLAVRAAH